MEKYIKINSIYDKNLKFYYKVDDYITYSQWQRPNKHNLLLLKDDFIKKFTQFKLYLTGHYNSNEPQNTWDVDLLITYKDIFDKGYKEKNYENIYDALYFLKTKGFKYNMLIDPSYSEFIINKSIIPKDILKFSKRKSIEEIKRMKMNEGEQIVIFKKIYKNKENDSFTLLLNDNIIKEIIQVNNKKLYILNSEKLSYQNFYNKFYNNIKNGCIYYGLRRLD